MHVALCHELVAGLKVNVFKTPRQIDALSLAHIYRLDNESLCLFLVELVLEVVLVRWQHPGLGEEVEIVLKGLLHACQVASQVILPGQGLHSWVRIYALMGSEFADLFGLDSDIRPIEVPVGRQIIIELELHLAADTLDDVVACGVCAQYQLLVGLLL